MKASFLIVDDEAGVRSALSGVLEDEGYRVDAVDSGEACLERVVRHAYDVIVLDIWLPGLDGLATLEKLRGRNVDAQVVMISGHGNIESAVRAIKMGRLISSKSLSHSTRPSSSHEMRSVNAGLRPRTVRSGPTSIAGSS